jgi:hypothetical protein
MSYDDSAGRVPALAESVELMKNRSSRRHAAIGGLGVA